MQALNSYSDFLVNPSFLEVDRFLVLLFENKGDRIIHTGYYIPKVKIRNYNNMTDPQNFFDEPLKNDMRTYDNIRKIETGQEDDNTTDCLLDYPYFKKHKLIAIDLSKQQALDADPKAIQPIILQEI